MDIMTSAGLVGGIFVIALMMFMGGDLHMFISEHAMIIIFGGSITATMIRFPLGVMLHGLPLGAKFAFTMSRLSARDLVDELARMAGQAAIGVDGELITLDRMGNDRRLVGIIAHLAHIIHVPFRQRGCIMAFHRVIISR